MKLLIVVSLAAMAVAAPSTKVKVDTDDIELLRYENNNNGLGTYKFSFLQSDGQKHEQQGELRNEGREGAYVAVKGSYTWFSPDGTEYVITYVADENGFKQNTEITLPGPGSPIPIEILETLLG